MSASRAAEIASRVAALGADPAARDDLVADGPVSPEMARCALQITVARYEPAALAALCTDEFARGGAAVLLARSVPTAPLRAVALALARGAPRVWVRAPRGQGRFAARVCRALDGAGGARVECAAGDDEGGAEFLAHAVGQGAGAVLAFGGDEALARVEADLPPGVGFEGRGHGLGCSVVLREAREGASAVEGVARDVAHYDQFGCLSPRFVLVEGDAADAVEAARGIAEALVALGRELPRARLDPALAARVNQWQGALAAQAQAFFRGPTHAVAALGPDAGALPDSPGARNVAVLPVRSPAHAAALLAPLAAHLTCVGVAGDRARLELPPGAQARVVPAGAMQDPPLDGYEDPRPPGLRRS